MRVKTRNVDGVNISEAENDSRFEPYGWIDYFDTLLQQLPNGLGSLAILFPNNSAEISFLLLLFAVFEAGWFTAKFLVVEKTRAVTAQHAGGTAPQNTSPFETFGEQLVNASALLAAVATHSVGLKCALHGGVDATDSSATCNYEGAERDGTFLLVLYGCFAILFVGKLIHLLWCDHTRLQTCHGVNNDYVVGVPSGKAKLGLVLRAVGL